MSPLRELERGGEAGGAAANDAHFLASGGGDLDRMLVAVLAHLVGGEVLELRDGDRLLHEVAAARLLAGVRAHAADGGGEREGLLDRGDGVRKATLGDFLHVLLAVRVGRAVELAGPLAVAVVVAHQKLERELARGERLLALRMHNHSGRDLRGAGAEHLGAVLHLHHAHAARAVGAEFLQVAEVGNLDSRRLGRLENGGAGRHAHGHVVNDEINQFGIHFKNPFT